MNYPPKPLWAPTDSLASLLGTYRFTGNPFWWSFGTTTDSLASFRGFMGGPHPAAFLPIWVQQLFRMPQKQESAREDRFGASYGPKPNR